MRTCTGYLFASHGSKCFLGSAAWVNDTIMEEFGACSGDAGGPCTAKSPLDTFCPIPRHPLQPSFSSKASWTSPLRAPHVGNASVELAGATASTAVWVRQRNSHGRPLPVSYCQICIKHFIRHAALIIQKPACSMQHLGLFARGLASSVSRLHPASSIFRPALASGIQTCSILCQVSGFQRSPALVIKNDNSNKTRV